MPLSNTSAGPSRSVEAAYRRGDLFEKRIAVMDAWAGHCGRLPTAEEERGQVIAFGAR
jgi:hypothetical protein